MDDPTPTDYAFLIILKTDGRELVSNTELRDVHGVTLIGAECTRLNGLGYVDSVTDRRPYRHTLTRKGADLLDRKLAVADDGVTESKARTKEKQLWAALAALHEYHRTGRPGAPPAGVVPAAPAGTNGGLEQRIRAAYDQLATNPGAWVSLTRLRPLFADVSKAELDGALRGMLDASDVNLEPEANQKTLKVEDRRAAVRIGGEDRHLLAIGLR